MINTTDIECIAERLKIPKEDLEQFYIYAIRSVINEYMNDLDTSSLDAIIVTGRLLDSIKDYQHEHGMIEEATDNAFGSVFGKTIHDKQTGKQVVFLDAWEMLGLLDNNSIEQLYKDNEEQKKEAYIHRNHLINLLAHELSHVEYNSQVITETAFPKDNSFDLYHDGLGIIMFEEYYACRRAAEISIPFYHTTLEKTIIDIETEVEDLVQRYIKAELLADAFIKQFQELLQLSLKYICYLLGDALSNENVDHELKDSKIQGILDCIKKEFNVLYDSAREKHRVLIPLVIRECMIKYYNMFKIDFLLEQYEIRIKYLG